jgi:hypothetical protein
MSRSALIIQSDDHTADAGADAPPSVEASFAGVDELLLRLAHSHADEPHGRRSRFRSWALAATCAIGFTCLPGYETDAFSQMRSANPDSLFVEEESVSAKADRLPLLQPVNHLREAELMPSREFNSETDLFEPVLRGSIEHIPFAPPAPNAAPPSNARKSHRIADRTAPIKSAVEFLPLPPPPSPSLLEKLFSVIPSVSQSPILQNQRQT